jgi:hypothetical protein
MERVELCEGTLVAPQCLLPFPRDHKQSYKHAPIGFAMSVCLLVRPHAKKSKTDNLM